MSTPFQFIQVTDFVESSANPPSATTKWKAVGTTSWSYVNAYAIGATPGIVSTLYGTLYRQDIRVQQTAYDQWTVTVPYGTRQNESGQWTWDFDTTGGTVHITHALEEVRRYPNTAPNQEGAIAVDGAEVKGSEIVIPSMRLNVSYRHPFGAITIAQAKFLRSITGTVNSTPMLGHAPGEVLFLGARGSDGSDAEVSVNYMFAMSENASNLTFGSIASVVKKGHELIWIKYKDATKSVAGTPRPVKVPQYVYIDRVYDEIDHATALGFGG